MPCNPPPPSSLHYTMLSYRGCGGMVEVAWGAGVEVARLSGRYGWTVCGTAHCNSIGEPLGGRWSDLWVGLRRVWWSGLYGCTTWRVVVEPIGWTASQSTVVRPIGWTVCGCQANRLDRMMGWWSGLYGCTTWGIGGGQANRLHPAPSNPSLTSILPSEMRAGVVCWQEGSSGERERERR
jgi:hypothetical protein